MELAYINIATPLPGTQLFERLKAAGRIFDWDWSRYDGKHVVFRPMRMTPETLQEGFFWANREFFSMASIATRMSATSQRLVSRFVMNWRFRQLVRRTTPKGQNPPLGRMLKKLTVQIPSTYSGRLIPNALHAVRSSVEEAAQQIDRYLQIKVRKHEGLRTLLIELEGTLDQINVAELRRRLQDTAKRAQMDIVINFEHLKYAAPEALAGLLEWVRNVKPALRVRVMNLKNSFKETVDHVALGAVEVSKEEL
jgi:anti-anti-sigma regulatory factor